MMPLMWNTSDRPHTSDLANSGSTLAALAAPTEKQSAAVKSVRIIFVPPNVLLQFELPSFVHRQKS
jgi:hypothetical protein